MADLEQKLLAKLTDVKQISRVYERGLRADVFVDPKNRVAFEWMIDYWLEANMSMAPTWLVMETEFPALHLSPSTEDNEVSTDWLIDHLKRRHVQNQAQKLLIEAAETLDADPLYTIGQLWRDAYSLSETTIPRSSRANMADPVNIAERRRLLAARRDNADVGVPFGMQMLDDHTRGILPGELAIVVARTKVGKSFLLCKSAIQAHLAGRKPIVFTLEMSNPEMWDRIDAFASGVSYTQIQSGLIIPTQEEALHRAQEALAARGDLHVERPPRGERTVKAMIARARQVGADIVYIDQLSFIDSDHRYTGDRAVTSKQYDLIQELKDEVSSDSAGKLPCLMAVQHNREATKSGRSSGGRGALETIANSDMIGQTVDMALGLWRNEDMRNNNQMGIDIMGSRRCDNESWMMTWRLDDRTEVEIQDVYHE